MTHFYMEIGYRLNFTSKKNTLKNLFQRKFPITNFIEDESFQLFIGDYVENNYRFEKGSQECVFSFNEITKPILDEKNKTKLVNVHQENYSPLITYNIINKDIMVITDPFGLDFIYITFLNGKIRFSSHIKYLLIAEPSLLNELDYDAIIEYLSNHAILGKKTLFKNIKLIPYNAKIHFKNWKDESKEAFFNRLNEYSFWYKFPEKFDESIDEHELGIIAENIAKSIQELIIKVTNLHNNKNAFFLSGGLDSRILVASIPEELKSKSSAYTFDSIYNGNEISTASAITKLIGIDHFTTIINANDIVENCYRHIWMNEGYSNHVVSILQKLIELNKIQRVFVDGYAGDTQFGGEFLSDIEMIVTKQENAVDQLQEIMVEYKYAFPKKLLSEILAENQNLINTILLNGYNEQCSMMWNTNNKFLKLECLLMQTRVRGYTIGGPRTVINYGPVILPFYHPEIFEKYIPIPQELRSERKLEINTLEFINKGLSQQPATSLKWYNKLSSTKFVQFGLSVLKKIESMFGVRVIPTYSSVPYFEWIREKKSYYHFLVDILDNPNAIIWNILDQEKTKKFFNDFVRRKNHQHKFILHIIDLEMILRLYFSLKDDKSSIYLISKTHNFRKDVTICLDLEYLLEITKP